ncbi:endonuclease 1 isoform X1 [Aegilops tauschii subsp. strangulata]|nr:endonuclease 1-like isoform X1 [Triticum aestivum]
MASSAAFMVAAVLGLVLASAPAARAWSTEGHMLTCQIAQDLLEPAAAQAVKNLLPEEAGGDLSAMCVWPDQVRHWYKYRWTSPLHFIDTPDKACTFDYARDCHDPSGAKDMCVAGAVANFTSQLMHYKQGSADRKCKRLCEGADILYPAFLHHCSEVLNATVANADNLTEALLFLSHFMGDIHQPMHVGFTSDMGGNSVNLRWFKHKSNLHHVWDREIILTVLAERYGKDMAAFRKDLQHNITKGSWSDESSWKDCADLMSCPTKYATESIGLACKWGYDGVHDGDTLSEDYFGSRLPIVTRRIAQGGVRLAMFLNRVFGDHKPHSRDVAAPVNLVVAHDDEL